MKSERQSCVEPDMSPEAIDRRMRTVSQLHRLGKELRHARYLGQVEGPEAVDERRRSEPDSRG